MQRPRRNSLFTGSYVDASDDGNVVVPEIVLDEAHDDTDDYSSDTDDEFVPEEPRVEVDRCEFISYFCIRVFVFGP